MGFPFQLQVSSWVCAQLIMKLWNSGKVEAQPPRDNASSEKIRQMAPVMRMSFLFFTFSPLQ
jgi:hypothetical protein